MDIRQAGKTKLKEGETVVQITTTRNSAGYPTLIVLTSRGRLLRTFELFALYPNWYEINLPEVESEVEDVRF